MNYEELINYTFYDYNKAKKLLYPIHFIKKLKLLDSKLSTNPEFNKKLYTDFFNNYVKNTSNYADLTAILTAHLYKNANFRSKTKLREILMSVNKPKITKLYNEFLGKGVYFQTVKRKDKDNKEEEEEEEDESFFSVSSIEELPRRRARTPSPEPARAPDPRPAQPRNFNIQSAFQPPVQAQSAFEAPIQAQSSFQPPVQAQSIQAQTRKQAVQDFFSSKEAQARLRQEVNERFNQLTRAQAESLDPASITFAAQNTPQFNVQNLPEQQIAQRNRIEVNQDRAMRSVHDLQSRIQVARYKPQMAAPDPSVLSSREERKEEVVL